MQQSSGGGSRLLLDGLQSLNEARNPAEQDVYFWLNYRRGKPGLRKACCPDKFSDAAKSLVTLHRLASLEVHCLFVGLDWLAALNSQYARQRGLPR